jgi:hypothetical protein
MQQTRGPLPSYTYIACIKQPNRSNRIDKVLQDTHDMICCQSINAVQSPQNDQPPAPYPLLLRNSGRGGEGDGGCQDRGGICRRRTEATLFRPGTKRAGMPSGTNSTRRGLETFHIYSRFIIRRTLFPE